MWWWAKSGLVHLTSYTRTRSWDDKKLDFNYNFDTENKKMVRNDKLKVKNDKRNNKESWWWGGEGKKMNRIRIARPCRHTLFVWWARDCSPQNYSDLHWDLTMSSKVEWRVLMWSNRVCPSVHITISTDKTTHYQDKINKKIIATNTSNGQSTT